MGMRMQVALFCRAFAIVFLTAANVVFITHMQWIAMAVTGFGISWVWWENTQMAVDFRERKSQLAYASGAAAGTLVGAGIANQLQQLF